MEELFIMNKIRVIFFFLTVSCLTTQAIKNFPECKAARIKKISPVIDGCLDDSCWESAQWQTNFHPLNGGNNLSNKTRFKVVFDDEKLYFAIECFEKRPDRMKIRARDKDDPVYSDDSVEIFIIPEEHLSLDPNIIEYYQFAINPAGVQFDSFYKGGVGEVKWNAQWRSAIKITENSWILEIAIPFYNFNISAATSSSWRLNLARNRVGDNGQHFSWAEMEHSFNQPRKFGYLRGLEVDFKDYLLSFSPPETTTILESSKLIPAINLKTKNNSMRTQKIQLELQLLQDDDVLVKLKDIKLVPGEEVKKIIELPEISKSGKYKCNIVLSVANRIIKFEEYTINFDILPITISMDRPKYRKTIFSSQPEDVVLNVKFMNSAVKTKRYSLSFELKKRCNDKLLYRKTVKSPKKKFQIRFDSQKLAFGNYTIEIVLLDNGKKVCCLTEKFRKVAVLGGNEVRIGDDLNLIFNGKEIFPHGFFATDSAAGLDEKGFNCGHSYVMHYFEKSKAQKILNNASVEKLPMIFYPYYNTGITFFGFRKGKGTVSEISKIQLASMVKRIRELKDNHGILGWYLCDEPRGAKFHKSLEYIYQTLEREDPYHPVFALDNSASGCIALSNSADILMLDYYPDFKRHGKSFKPLVSIYHNIQAIRRATRDRLPVWYVAQAFNRAKFTKNPLEQPYRAPTYLESRCMDYLALVAGAKGIMYYLLRSKPGILQDNEMKTGILDGLGPEIRDISPILLQKSIEGAKASDPKIYLMLKRYKRNYFLIGVNPSYQSINNVKLRIKELTHNKIKVLFEDRMINVADSAFRDNFAPLEVHVYSTNIDFTESIRVRDIVNKIKNDKEKSKSLEKP